MIQAPDYSCMNIHRRYRHEMTYNETNALIIKSGTENKGNEKATRDNKALIRLSQVKGAGIKSVHSICFQITAPVKRYNPCRKELTGMVRCWSGWRWIWVYDGFNGRALTPR